MMAEWEEEHLSLTPIPKYCVGSCLLCCRRNATQLSQDPSHRQPLLLNPLTPEPLDQHSTRPSPSTLAFQTTPFRV